jgi:hypothetical protein
MIDARVVLVAVKVYFDGFRVVGRGRENGKKFPAFIEDFCLIGSCTSGSDSSCIAAVCAGDGASGRGVESEGGVVDAVQAQTVGVPLHECEGLPFVPPT